MRRTPSVTIPPANKIRCAILIILVNKKAYTAKKILK